MANPNPNMSGLTPFTSTYQPKKKGRKPSQWKKFCKEYDLSDIDRKFVAQVLLSKKSKDEIFKMVNEKELPFGVWAACVAAISDAKKGGTGFLTYLFDAAFGKQTDKVEHSGGMFFDKMPPELRKARLKELMEKYQENEEPDEPKSKE